VAFHLGGGRLAGIERDSVEDARNGDEPRIGLLRAEAQRQGVADAQRFAMQPENAGGKVARLGRHGLRWCTDLAAFDEELVVERDRDGQAGANGAAKVSRGQVSIVFTRLRLPPG